MYKLTIEFKTAEELNSFTSNLGRKSTPVEAINEVKEVEAKKPIAPKAPKAAAKVQEIEIPAVIVAPTLAAAPSIGKEALVAQAQVLVNALKASGIAESQIMPTINGAFTAAGIPVGQRISALDELSLVKFMPIFELAVNSIISGTPHSFI
jgi:hypothetical protein